MGRNWVDVLALVVLGGMTVVVVGFLVAYELAIDVWAFGPLGAVRDFVYSVELGLNQLEVVYGGMGIAFGLVVV